jgi:hypothetical protein
MFKQAKLFGLWNRAVTTLKSKLSRRVGSDTPPIPSIASPANTHGNRSPALPPSPRPIPLKAKHVERIGNRFYFRDSRGQLWRVMDRGVVPGEYLLGRRGPWYVGSDATGGVRWVI